MSEKPSYGIIILAAGNSSRLGEPKQLLQFKNKSLICHVTEEAINAVGSPVIIVTGSNYELISDEVKLLLVPTVYNEHWRQGMASSICIGLAALLDTNPSLQGAIISVSDQPFVTSALFKDLIETTWQTSRGIVASSYDNTLGTPVLFQSQYFPALLNLKGSEGAKKLLKLFKEDVAEVPFPPGNIDIDTQEDYNKLIQRNKSN